MRRVDTMLATERKKLGKMLHEFAKSNGGVKNPNASFTFGYKFPDTRIGMLMTYDEKNGSIFVRFEDGEFAKMIYGQHYRLNPFHGEKFNFHFGASTALGAFAEFKRDIAPVFQNKLLGAAS